MAWSQLTSPKFALDFLLIYRGSVPPVIQVEEVYLFPNSPPGVNHAQNKTPFEPLNDFISTLGLKALCL